MAAQPQSGVKKNCFKYFAENTECRVTSDFAPVEMFNTQSQPYNKYLKRSKTGR